MSIDQPNTGEVSGSAAGGAARPNPAAAATPLPLPETAAPPRPRQHASYSAVSFLVDPQDGRIVDANDATVKFYGYSRAQLLTMSVMDLDPRATTAEVAETVAHMRANPGLSYSFEHRLADGTYCAVEVMASRAWDGTRELMQATLWDVSARQRAHDALRHSEESFRSQFIGNAAVMFIADPIDGHIIDANMAAVKFYGYSRERLLTMSITDLNPQATFTSVQANMARMMSEHGLLFEFEHQRADGALRTVEVIGSRLWRAGSWVLHVLVWDVTARKRATEALRLSEDAYHRQFSQNATVMMLIDPLDGLILNANDAAVKFYGYPRERLLAMHIYEINQLALPSVFDEMDKVKVEGGGRFKFCHRLADGALRTVMVITSRLHLGGNWVLHSIIIDVSERERLAQELESAIKRESLNAAFLTSIMESAPGIIIFALDKDHRYTAFNQAHQRAMKSIWGKEITLGQNMLEVIGMEADRERAKINFDRALRGETLFLVEEYGQLELQRNIYENRYAPMRDQQGVVVGLTCFVVDITKVKQLETENAFYRMKQAKTEANASLDRVTAAIVHLLNNNLQVVVGNLELALGTLPPAADAVEYLNRAITAVDISAELCTKLHTYVGRPSGAMGSLDLAEVCRTTLRVIQPLLPPGIALELDLPASGPTVNASTADIAQCLTNLTANAWEACNDGPGKISIALTTDTPAMQDADAVFPYGWVPRNTAHACLEVADTGSGIAAADIEKICDPFYTTKFSGRGLGLSVVAGIARSSAWGLTVKSQAGQGTVFRLWLPLDAGRGA